MSKGSHARLHLATSSKGRCSNFEKLLTLIVFCYGERLQYLSLPCCDRMKESVSRFPGAHSKVLCDLRMRMFP